jgi:RNA polymerase sigma-70 factor (ECF subfamily)
MPDPVKKDAADLAPVLYDELRALAGAFFRNERKQHTLQPTALVHEAWLRLAKSEAITLGDRTSFLVVASITMRRILVEHARRRDADKRGGGWTRVALEEGQGASSSSLSSSSGSSFASASSSAALEVDVLAVHEALEELASLSERQARIVEMRWFGGLTVPEIATILGLVPRTVEKDWTMAKAWLRRRLADAR